MSRPAIQLPSITEIEAFKKSLAPWVNEAGIDSEQRRNRVGASKLILAAYESNKDNLNLYGYDLTSLPQAIGDLRNLVSLNLANNKLDTLPATIGNLSKLEYLGLSNNELTVLPTEITNMIGLVEIDLDSNWLNNVPDLILKLPKLRLLTVKNNDLSVEDQKKIETTLLLPGILPLILELEPDELKREELSKFILENPELDGFRALISRCNETKSWETDSGRKSIYAILHQIITAVNQDPQIATTVNAISLGSDETCGDRVALTLLEAQLAALHFHKQPQEMEYDTKKGLEEAIKYAREKSGIKFLTGKAVERAKTNPNEEVETHLAYMQVAKDLGIHVKGADMLFFEKHSKVSAEDLRLTKAQYEAPSKIRGMKQGDFLTLSYMLNAPEFEDIGFIRDVKTKVANKREYDTTQKNNEKDGQYLVRLKSIQEKVEVETVKRLKDYLGKSFDASKISDAPDTVSKPKVTLFKRILSLFSRDKDSVSSAKEKIEVETVKRPHSYVDKSSDASISDAPDKDSVIKKRNSDVPSTTCKPSFVAQLCRMISFGRGGGRGDD